MPARQLAADAERQRGFVPRTHLAGVGAERRALGTGLHHQRGPRRGLGFGIAGATGSEETDPTRVAATQMNLVLVGTIAHADPQQGFAIVGESAPTARVYAVGKTITGGADQYSLTVVAYEMLTGEKPFTGALTTIAMPCTLWRWPAP